jgi:predicted DNA-binding transcriptional regulator AlpA
VAEKLKCGSAIYSATTKQKCGVDELSRTITGQPMTTYRIDADDEDDALTAKEAAAFFGVSLATFWRRVNGGDSFPQPFYPAERTPRWIRRDLREARERLRMTPAEARERRHKAKLARRAAEVASARS